jgi:hypothetical protein
MVYYANITTDTYAELRNTGKFPRMELKGRVDTYTGAKPKSPECIEDIECGFSVEAEKLGATHVLGIEYRTEPSQDYYGRPSVKTIATGDAYGPWRNESFLKFLAHRLL